MSSNNSQVSCLGSRLVVLVDKNETPSASSSSSSLAREGLVAVFRTADESLEVRLCTSTMHVMHTYSHILDATKIRLAGGGSGSGSGSTSSGSEKKADDRLIPFLLRDGRDHEDISVRFEHVVEDSIHLTIQQRLASSGLQRFVYQGRLARMPTVHNLLAFSAALGDSLNASLAQVHTLQEQLEQKEKSIMDWKETADSLSRNIWQAEKDKLVHQFVQLWNELRQKTQAKCQALQDELALTQKALVAVKHQKKKSRRTLQLGDDDDDKELAQALKDTEDDLAAQHEPVDPIHVQALAAGKRIATADKDEASNRKSMISANDALDLATLEEQAKEYEATKKKQKKGSVAGKKRKQSSSNHDESEDDQQPATRPKPSRKNKRQKVAAEVDDDDKMVAGSPIIYQDSDDEDFRSQIRAGITKALSSSEEETD